MNFLLKSITGLNHSWRYIIGVFIVLMAYIFGQLPVLLARLVQLENHPSIGTKELNEFDKTMNFEIIHISRNGGFVLLLLMFVIGMLGLYMVVKYLHKKNFIDIITSRPKIDWRRVFVGFGLWLAIIFVMEFVTYLIDPDNYTQRQNIDAESYFVLIVVSLTLLFVQTSFEELYFRGYIMQGVAYFSGKPWISILVSSLLFAAMHLANPEISEYGLAPMAMYYIIAALFLALVTVMDDGMELALGMHWATNLFGTLFLTYNGAVIQTDTIFVTQHINVYLLIITFVVGAVIMYLLCNKIYKWPHITVMDKELLISRNNDVVAKQTTID
jgi:membrane protease YdiL (CAAX protease family)